MTLPQDLPDTITELAPLLLNRTISPVEVTRACLDRIEALDPRLCAYTAVFSEEALAQASRAEERLRQGEARGSLCGIPVSVKDVYKTRGRPTTWGAKALAGHVTDVDATVVVKLREAGAILIGKTNVDAYPYHGSPDVPRLIGPTRNPWDPARTAGRSSGGSGAAVAARLDYGSMGSDTGGSIRIPASLCGVVGLKPTFGRVSRHGVLLYSDAFDHCGPIAGSVRDCALLFEAITGLDAHDPSAADAGAPDCAGEFGKSVEGIRVGVPYADIDGDDPEIRELALEAIEVLAGLGTEVRPVTLPSLSDARWITIVSTLQTAAMADELAAASDPRDRFAKFMIMRSMAERKRLLKRGRQISEAAKARYAELFRDVDVIIMPTVPVVAPKFEEEHSRWQLPEEAFWELLARHTRVFNFTGAPAITVPCGLSADAMPVGLQIAGRPFEETTIFRVAYACEQATRWHTLRPPRFESTSFGRATREGVGRCERSDDIAGDRGAPGG